jgi:hypothetical protein
MDNGNCCGCGKSFVLGDRVLTFCIEEIKRGEKSGKPGFYTVDDSLGQRFWSLEDNVDHVHYTPGCLELAFSPPDNPFMFEMLAGQVRQQIYEEESENERDIPVMPELPVLLEDPPFCLDCKRTDTVWTHFAKGYPIYSCIVCNILWDHEEDRLYWDPERADYFLVPDD